MVGLDIVRTGRSFPAVPPRRALPQQAAAAPRALRGRDRAHGSPRRVDRAASVGFLRGDGGLAHLAARVPAGRSPGRARRRGLLLPQLQVFLARPLDRARNPADGRGVPRLPRACAGALAPRGPGAPRFAWGRPGPGGRCSADARAPGVDPRGPRRRDRLPREGPGSHWSSRSPSSSRTRSSPAPCGA